MKALLSRRCGGPETLVMADVPEPEPAAGQVRIAVRACGINYPDVLMIEDKYQFRPERPFSPGVEISGVIDSVAEDVTGFESGQRVMASIPCGGLAEWVCAAAARCIAIPDAPCFEKKRRFATRKPCRPWRTNSRHRLPLPLAIVSFRVIEFARPCQSHIGRQVN
jgi:NADPH2:quinone reductase